MKSLIIILSSLISSYLLCDYVYSLKKRNYRANVFSENCIKNSIRYGYEYYPNQKCRYKRVVKNHLEYDNTFFTNNFGFVSDLNYKYENEKKSLRAVVLGYSMTEGNYIKTNWPTRASTFSDGEIEVFNFARAGYFNLNLYNIYFDLVSKFSFDYIFLPVIGKTDEQFMIFEKRQDGIYDGLFKNTPKSEREFVSNFSPNMNLMYSFFKTSGSSSFSQQFDISARNYVLLKDHMNKLLAGETRADSLNSHRSNLIDDYESDQFYKHFGERNVKIFLSIVSHALKKGAKVVFYQDPKKGSIPSEVKKDSTHYLFQWLDKIHPNKIFYLDGNKFFTTFSKKEYEGLFFKYDGHWNQKGSDVFAKGVVDFLRKGD